MHANAGRDVASLPVPPGATPQAVEAGAFHGRGGASCTACHGVNTEGTALAPSLTTRDRIWGDGSYPNIVKIVKNGVPQPQKFSAPMPPMGGAQLSDEQVSDVAAYVWAISHR